MSEAQDGLYAAFVVSAVLENGDEGHRPFVEVKVRVFAGDDCVASLPDPSLFTGEAQIAPADAEFVPLAKYERVYDGLRSLLGLLERDLDRMVYHAAMEGTMAEVTCAGVDRGHEIMQSFLNRVRAAVRDLQASEGVAEGLHRAEALLDAGRGE